MNGGEHPRRAPQPQPRSPPDPDSLTKMTGRKEKGKPRDVADPTDFLNTYFRDRGIKRSIDSVAISECLRRAEEARENFKRMRPPAAPDPLDPGATGALSDAQKYSRRLLNNRKSAAATRVFQEVLKREQAHTLTTVENERDRYAADFARVDAERSKVEKEVAELRAMVKELKKDKMPTPNRLGHLTGTIPPVLYVPSEGSQMKMEMTQSQEQEITMLPPIAPISTQSQDLEEIEGNAKSLRISFKAGEALNFGMMGSQSTQDPDAKINSQLVQDPDSEVKTTPMSPKISPVGRPESALEGGNKDKMPRAKFPTGSSIRVGVLNSQLSQTAMPVNLRFSMASQDLEAVEDVFPPSQSQGAAPMKILRPLGM